MKAVLCVVALVALFSAVNAADIGCVTCKTLIGKMEAWLAENKTEQVIMADLEKLCALLPNRMQYVCDSIVQEVPLVIAKLEAKESPEVICQQIKICPAFPVPQGVFECDACKMIMGAIEGWIESNKTISEIEYLLDQLCKLLGNTFDPICERIVQIGLEEIIQWINNNESPLQICQQIGMCTAPPRVKNVIFCDVCKTLIGAIEGWVLSNKTVTEIETLLDELCALLGNTVEPVCDMIVKIGVEEVVTWIENNENPTEICTQLLVCPMPKAHRIHHHKQVGDTFWCETCRVLMTVLEDWLESNKTISEIEQAIDQLCALLGEPFQEVCDAIVDVGIHKIIEWINNDESPQIICQQLGLCPMPAHGMHKGHKFHHRP